jgi:dTMP kinase
VGQSLTEGRLVTLEGGEGAGKTTQIGLLADALRQAGSDVLTTREPGGSTGAEEIRRLLLGGAPERWDAEAEALLMVAARRDHLVATIWPALQAGKLVICDRFSDSTEAYQGAGRGLAVERLAALHRFIAADFAPALTLILDLPATDGLARAQQRGATTRFERMPLDFHERLRQGFLAIARREPERCVVIDARRSVAAVHEDVKAAVRERLHLAV